MAGQMSASCWWASGPTALRFGPSSTIATIPSSGRSMRRAENDA